jgi:hypothetical protein
MNETIKKEKETLLIEFIGKIESGEDLSSKDFKKYINNEYDKELEKGNGAYLSSYKTTFLKRK